MKRLHTVVEKLSRRLHFLGNLYCLYTKFVSTDKWGRLQEVTKTSPALHMFRL